MISETRKKRKEARERKGCESKERKEARARKERMREREKEGSESEERKEARERKERRKITDKNSDNYIKIRNYGNEQQRV